MSFGPTRTVIWTFEVVNHEVSTSHLLVSVLRPKEVVLRAVRIRLITFGGPPSSRAIYFNAFSTDLQYCNNLLGFVYKRMVHQLSAKVPISDFITLTDSSIAAFPRRIYRLRIRNIDDAYRLSPRMFSNRLKPNCVRSGDHIPPITSYRFKHSRQ